MKKTVVSLSGGLDSCVALKYAVDRSQSVLAVSFKYGSNHQEMENAAACKICNILGVKHVDINLDFIKTYFKSSLLNGAIPDGHYEDEIMRSTVVPFRNGIMLSILAGIADSYGFDEIMLANHSGDHFIYPDCRPEFISSISDSIFYGTDGRVSVVAPFVNLTKSDIVKLGVKIGAPLELTYSCYKGCDRHCGKCGTCIERKEAFEHAGIIDPTIYEE